MAGKVAVSLAMGSASTSDGSKTMKKAFEILLTLVIVGATLDFGGVLPLAYSLVEVILLFAALWVLLHMTRKGQIAFRVPWGLALFLLIVLLQTVPLPMILVRWLSPERVSGPAAAIMSSSGSHWLTLSIYAFGTRAALLLFLAYVCAFALASWTFESSRRSSILVRGLIVLGAVEACYGIVQYLTGWQKIFTYTKTFYTQDATGTYINHDHFAGFLEMVFPFLLAGVYYHFQIWQEGSHGDESHRATAVSAPGMRALIYLFVLLILLLAAVLSLSRTGILSSLVTLFFVGILAGLRRQGARQVWLLGMAALLVSVLAYGAWIGLGPALTRFEQVKEPGYLTTEGRVGMWKDSLQLIRHYPIVGSGLGTFGVAYRRYQTALVTYYVDHAHEDYLEYAAETGVPGAALLFLSILWLWGRMIVSFLTDSRRFRSSILLGCIGATTAILIHSFMDFNLHIPANALIFAAILGIGYKASCLEPREESQRVGRPAWG
jgi:O-antigen ligase